MKKIIFQYYYLCSFCLMLLVFSACLNSCSNEGKIIQYDGLNYKVQNGNAIVIGKYTSKEFNVVKIHSYLLNKYKVISIAENAFSNDELLAEVIIEDGVQMIAPYAFNKCEHLHKVIIPNTVKYIGKGAFMNCKNLVQLVLPNEIEEIEDSCFYNTQLRSINIPQKVRFIGKAAFANTNLHTQTLIFPNSLERIDDTAFSNANIFSVRFPSSLKYIGNSAFSKNAFLSRVYVPDSILEIGRSAFGRCNLFQIKISNTNPNFIVKNGCLMSKYSRALIAVSKESIKGNLMIIPDGVEELDTDIIDVSGEPNYVDIILPKSLKIIHKSSIRSYSYSERKNWIKLVIPSSVEMIEAGFIAGANPYYAFEVDPNNSNFKSNDGVLYNKTMTRLICYPSHKRQKTFVIPPSVQTIDEHAFSNCEELEILNRGINVKKIDGKIVDGCSNLVRIDVSGADSIMDKIYHSYKNDPALVLSEYTKYIHFSNIWKNSVYCYAKHPPMIGGITGDEEWIHQRSSLHVPEDLVYVYQSDTIWSKFCRIWAL